MSRCEPVAGRILPRGPFSDVTCAESAPHVVPPLRGVQSRTRFRQDPEFGSANPPFSLQGADSSFFSFLSLGRPSASFVPSCARPVVASSGMQPLDPRPRTSCGAFPSAAKPLFQQFRHSRPSMCSRHSSHEDFLFRRNIATCASSAHVWRSSGFLGLLGVRSLLSFWVIQGGVTCRGVRSLIQRSGTETDTKGLCLSGSFADFGNRRPSRSVAHERRAQGIQRRMERRPLPRLEKEH